MTRKSLQEAAVVILENSDGQILITKRPDTSPMAGLWEFPGGKKEMDEDSRMCAAREIEEELGVALSHSNIRFLGCFKHDYEDFTLHLDVHYCSVWRGSFDPREGQEMTWVGIDDLSAYTMPDANANLIKCLPSLLEHVHHQLEGV